MSISQYVYNKPIFGLFSHFEQMRTVTIFGEHGIIAHIPRRLGQSALELHYPMIQFLIILITMAKFIKE